MHLQACRLVARRFADDDCLDKVPYDRHQPALGSFLGVVARKEDQLANCNPDVCRIELRLQLLDLALEILYRLFDGSKFAGELWPAAGFLDTELRCFQ